MMKHLHSDKKLLDEYSGEHQLITYLGANSTSFCKWDSYN